MPSVLSYTNAFLGIQYPQKFSANTKVQSFLYPGALQPTVNSPPPSVLTNAEAFLGIQYPQKFSANTKVQSFLYPGAVQPAVNSAAVAVTGYRNMIFIPRWDPMMWGWNP